MFIREEEGWVDAEGLFRGDWPRLVSQLVRQLIAQFGGFTVIEAADDEAARYWAGRLAVALDWPQEVHRFPSGMDEIVEKHGADAQES